MSSKWQSYKLCETGTIITGKTPKSGVPEFLGNDVPFITPPDFGNEKWIMRSIRRISERGAQSVKSSFIPPRSVLVTCIGSDMGKVALVPTRCITNQQINAISVDEKKFSPEFLYYNLSLRKSEIQGLAGGSAQPILNKSAFGTISFSAPNLREQLCIVEILRPLDDRITLLRETNKTLEAIAQAIFKSWFVDFDPVRAKMEGRQPEGMDEATAALFPDSFEESELGLVPKGWQFLPFGQLLEHTIGGDWGAETPDDKNNVRVAIVRGTDIPDLKAGANLRVPIRYTSQKKLTPRAIQSGDIIIEVSGGSKEQPTGRSLYISTELLNRFDCPVEAASFCRLLRPISKEIGMVLAQHMSYIYEQGKTWEYQNQSTGIANFQTTYFLEKELVTVPSQAILNLYSSIVAPLLQRTSLTQIQSLTDIRDTLLPRLISGQLRLPEAQEQIENA